MSQSLSVVALSLVAAALLAGVVDDADVLAVCYGRSASPAWGVVIIVVVRSRGLATAAAIAHGDATSDDRV